MSAPERIWVHYDAANKRDLAFDTPPRLSWYDGYILASPEALAASTEVQALIAAERDRHIAIYAECDRLKHERNRQHVTQLHAVTEASTHAIEGVIKAMHNDGVTVISLAALERTVAIIRNRGTKP